MEERNQAIKMDINKPMLELIPPSAVLAIGEIMTYGAEKYSPHSWRTVEKERYVGALLRHMMAYMSGEINDPESGMPHMWHVLTNAAFITDLDQERKEVIK